MKVTDFMLNLQKQLVEEKKLAESTSVQYLQTLWSLNEKQPFKNLAWTKKTDILEERLKHFAPSTQLNYTAVLVTALSLLADKTGYKKIYNYWKTKMNDMKKERDTTTNGNDKTDTQEENWVEWSEIEKKKSGLKAVISSFASNKNITPTQYDKLLQYVVISLYTDIPPRRNEYLDMYVVKKLPANAETNRNYYDMSTKKFIFNKYKTSKTYGQQILDIPESLQFTLELFIKHHPLAKSKLKEFKLLVKSDGTPLNTVNSITRILNRVIGKRVGSSMLRHIYITSKFGDNIKELQEVAKDMGHSTQEQQGTYYKVD